jgi:hypothetical protein
MSSLMAAWQRARCYSRSAQTIHIGPRIPVGLQRDKAEPAGVLGVLLTCSFAESFFRARRPLATALPCICRTAECSSSWREPPNLGKEAPAQPWGVQEGGFQEGVSRGWGGTQSTRCEPLREGPRGFGWPPPETPACFSPPPTLASIGLSPTGFHSTATLPRRACFRRLSPRCACHCRFFRHRFLQPTEAARSGLAFRSQSTRHVLHRNLRSVLSPHQVSLRRPCTRATRH